MKASVHSRFRWLLAAALLGAAGGAAAQFPPLPVIPGALPAPAALPLQTKLAQFEQQYKGLVDAGTRHNDRCRGVKKGSPEHADCSASLERLAGDIKVLRAVADKLEDEIDAAVAVERKRLQARDKELELYIAKDLTAVRGLGFDRRAQDFEEWEKLATDAKREFEQTVSKEATSLIAAGVKEEVLSGVKKLDAAKVEKWIGFLQKQDPPAVEIISVLRRMASVGDADRLKLATDAKYLAKLIENVAKSAKVDGWKDGLPVLLEILCDGFPSAASKQCKLFKATANATVASLYNNAARRVAQTEIERLTSLTESQLKALATINGLLVKHVKERREVKAKLKELEQ